MCGIPRYNHRFDRQQAIGYAARCLYFYNLFLSFQRKIDSFLEKNVLNLLNLPISNPLYYKMFEIYILYPSLKFGSQAKNAYNGEN